MRECIEILDLGDGKLPCLKKMELKKSIDYREFGDIIDHVAFETVHPITEEISYFVAVLRSSGLLIIWGYDFEKKQCWVVEKTKIHLRPKEVALTLCVCPLSQYLIVHASMKYKKASRVILFYFDENQLLKKVNEIDILIDNIGCFRALTFLQYNGRKRYVLGLSCERRAKLRVFEVDGQNNEFFEIEDLREDLEASYTYRFDHVEGGVVCSDYEGNKIRINYQVA